MRKVVPFALMVLITISAQSASAQGTKKFLKGIFKNAETAQQIGKQTLAANSSTKLASKAAQATVPPATITTAPSIPEVTINPTVSGFVTRHKQTLFRLQTAIGISQRRAVENLHKLGARPLQRPRKPGLLHGETFIVEDFTALGDTNDEVPAIPFNKTPKYLYRGMGLALDGKAVRNILENGLLIKDVGPDNNTRRLAYASGGGVGAMRAISRLRVINLTSTPSVALHYAWKYKEKGILVMVAVEGHPFYGTIITTPNDIPADRIHEMIALLSINGKNTWCRVELVPQGFKVTPYTVLFPQKMEQ